MNRANYLDEYFKANFKRAASMPNVKKGRRLRQPLQSSSNLSRSSTNIFAETSSGVVTATTNTFDSSYRKTALSPTKVYDYLERKFLTDY